MRIPSALPAAVAALFLLAPGVDAQSGLQVTLQPTQLALEPGESAVVAATVRDGGGSVAPGYEVAWRSTDSGVATVTDRGVVTAVAVSYTHLTLPTTPY